MLLRATKPIDDRILADLKDAADDITRRLRKLQGKQGAGADLTRAQLTAIRAQLRVVQRELFVELGREIRGSRIAIADAATDAGSLVDRMMFDHAGQRLPEELVEAQRSFARATVDTYFARGESAVPLSERVYKTKALADGLVDRMVNRMLLQGASWRELQAAVRGMIDPNTPGGVSYAAKRLARTEINNAFHQSQIKLAEQNPWVEGQKWNLSRQHPKADQCDVNANEPHMPDGLPGVYPKRDVPRKPHPQCYCYLTPVTIDEDEFFTRLLSGQYKDVSQNYLPALARAA